MRFTVFVHTLQFFLFEIYYIRTWNASRITHRNHTHPFIAHKQNCTIWRLLLRPTQSIFCITVTNKKIAHFRLSLLQPGFDSWAACGMSYTLRSQYLVVFPLGFSYTLRRARNCSNWNHIIRPTGLARTGDVKSLVFYLYLFTGVRKDFQDGHSWSL